MTQEQYLVIQFMKLFQQELHAKPTIPSLESRKLRAKLIMEEALETVAALGLSVEWTSIHCQQITPNSIAFYESNQPNLVEIADGLADLHYVAYCGTGAACGIDMEPVFAEVHRSNMSKMWTKEDIKQAKKLHPTGVVEHYGGGLYRILVDGKVIKSPSYSPANITQVLAKQGPINGSR